MSAPAAHVRVSINGGGEAAAVDLRLWAPFSAAAVPMPTRKALAVPLAELIGKSGRFRARVAIATQGSAVNDLRITLPFSVKAGQTHPVKAVRPNIGQTPFAYATGNTLTVFGGAGGGNDDLIDVYLEAELA